MCLSIPRRRSLRAACALLATVPPRPSHAQALAPDSATLADLAARLKDQSRIRVSLPAGHPAEVVLLGPRVVGSAVEFEGYAPGARIFDSTAGPHAIPISEIARIQVRGGAWEKGAVGGFVVGALAIGVVNLAGKYQIDRGETLFFELFFGTAGAAVGTPIGGIFLREWRTVYERSPGNPYAGGRGATGCGRGTSPEDSASAGPHSCAGNQNQQ